MRASPKYASLVFVLTTCIQISHVLIASPANLIESFALTTLFNHFILHKHDLRCAYSKTNNAPVLMHSRTNKDVEGCTVLQRRRHRLAPPLQQCDGSISELNE